MDGKITCEYCDSVLEYEEVKGTCPFCGASVADAMASYEEALRDEQAAREKARVEEEQWEQAVDVIKTVAPGILGALGGRSVFGCLRSAARLTRKYRGRK